MTTQGKVGLPQELTRGTWTIDPSHTEAAFVARHAGISKVRGSVAVLEGKGVVGETWESSNVDVKLDALSVKTGDSGRDQHLQSADFFDTANNPVWTFTSTRTEGDGPVARMEGNLTIRGVTNPVVLDVEFNGVATDPFGNHRAGFSASTEISRKDFDLTWNALLETGGVLVGDKVKIELEISAILDA